MFSDVLLAVDFDRTLTAPDSTIPRRNLDAIRYFMDNGGTFTIDTGRSVPMTNWFRDQVPVNAPLLLYNGSAAWDPATGSWGQCHEIQLDPETFINHLHSRFPDLTVEVQGPYAHHVFRSNPSWEAYSENCLCPWEYADPAKLPRPFLKVSIYSRFQGNTVASMYEATEKEMARMAEVTEWLKHQYGDLVDAFRVAARVIDIHAKGCSKLASARELQRQLGKKILVCVGDADNDLPMLEGADYAFCPADGVIADRFENVCPCAEGAVADVICKKIPEILGIRP